MQKSKYSSWPLIYYTELLSHLNVKNSDNLCSIRFKPFWLPQLPVTGEQAHSSTKKKA